MSNDPKEQKPEVAEVHPGDESPAGTPQTGENVCRTCGGSGRIEGGSCETCGGTGYVVVNVGDA